MFIGLYWGGTHGRQWRWRTWSLLSRCFRSAWRKPSSSSKRREGEREGPECPKVGAPRPALRLYDWAIQRLPVLSSPHPLSASPLFPIILYFIFFFPSLPRTKNSTGSEVKSHSSLFPRIPAPCWLPKAECMKPVPGARQAVPSRKPWPPQPSGAVGTPVHAFMPHCEGRPPPLLSSWRARRKGGHLRVGGDTCPPPRETRGNGRGGRRAGRWAMAQWVKSQNVPRDGN